MKITYIRLEHVAGLTVGSSIDKLEISFDESINKIICIQGMNGKGKSVLLSSLHPFSGVTSIDERSTLNYITAGKNGYKEIHYINGDDHYIIKHYYKPNKQGSHAVKSYFMKNDEELNENGNVSSFIALVQIHMGLTPEMMRLIRLGTNVNSFIKLTPAGRKEYVGKLIEEIDLYLKIHKEVNDELRVVKTLMSSNNTALYNCHISDPVVENEKLSQLSSDIKRYEKERDKLVGKIGKIQSLMNDNNIDELKKKRSEAEASLIDFNKTENKVNELSLTNVSVDQLIKERSELTDKRVELQGRINGYRISIDQCRKSIERLELSIKKIASNNDVRSLASAIEELRTKLDATPLIVAGFIPYDGITFDTVSDLVSKLDSFNHIGQMIYTLGNKPLDIYLKLVFDKKSVDDFLKKQAKKNLSRISENDIKSLFDMIFQDDTIIAPNCVDQFVHCPYYRLSNVITQIHDKMEEESYDDETLRYIQVISRNVDDILNQLDSAKHRLGSIPDKLKYVFDTESVFNRMKSKLQLFDMVPIQNYQTMLKEYEIYVDRCNRLKEYEHQLSVYKQSGVDSQVSEIKELEKNISFYDNNIDVLNMELKGISNRLDEVDIHIGLVSKYNDGKKYKKIIEDTLSSTNKILAPLESAASEKMELEFALRNITNAINISRENHKQSENKLREYERLMKEGKELADKYNDLSIIMEAVSTKKGIPVIYMKQYLGKIQSLANNLLKLIYDDELQLGRFNVTQDSFEVPYIKDGTKIPDVKYASQSEISLITMALSFALANRVSGNYNILLLDEIDAGLDEANRSAFLKMLYMQMAALKAEQVFIISHNLTQMINVPMDVIKLSETGVKSKLQNVIYE